MRISDWSSDVCSSDLLTEILGYKPSTLVTIEYVEDMADWKTAWDHIHFRGFLNTQLTLQFTWPGCDSLLAAPLVLDLVRFTERDHRRGTSGIRSEERRVGKAWFSTCRVRGGPS